MSILLSFRRLTIDNDAACLEVETADGVIVRAAAPRLSQVDSPELPRDFRRVTFVPADGVLVLSAPNSDELIIEVFRGEDQAERRGGRLVVYLDQNKWVELAGALYSPRRLSPQELDAAHTVIDLARNARLLLPLSSGHLIETGRCDRGWRQQLAPLMVSLSRGWIMRHPLRVRRTELRAIFTSRAGRTPMGCDVITLDPSQLYADDLPQRRPADLPEELAVLSATLSWVTSIYAVLLEDEVVHSVAGYEAAASWAASHQDLATELRSNSKARHLSRDVSRARFLTDLGMDLHESVAASGLTPESLADWLASCAEDDIAASPYLGCMRDVIHFRLRNADDTWEANDLIDMLFLPCAAAYADIVVLERKTGDYLRRAQRSRSDGAHIATSFVELVDVLSPSTGDVVVRSKGGAVRVGAERTDVAYQWPSTLVVPDRPPKLVYLDLNHWIALSKAMVGHRNSDPHVDALEACLRFVSDGRAVFPISDVIYMEVSKIGRYHQRRALREVIELVSQYFVVTARSIVSVHEVEAVLERLAGPSQRPVNRMAYLDWGVCRAFGKVGGLRVRDADGADLTAETRAAWKDGPEAFDAIFAAAELDLQRRSLDGPTPEEESHMRTLGWNPRAAADVADRRAAQELEQVARFGGDPSWRRGRIRDVVAAREVLIEINEPLYEGISDRAARFQDLFSSPEESRRVFDAMPSFDVAVTMKTSYHRDPNHRWTVNDLHDIDALGSAIPYCDIVVTDKAAARHANRSGLAERLGTMVISHLDDLVIAL